MKIKRTEGTPIDPKLVAESRKRISEAMKKVHSDFRKKQAKSLLDARKLIINS